MLDKGPWSHALDGVFPASCDNGLVKEVTCISSEETKASNHCLKSGNIGSVGSEFDDSDLILGEKGASNSTDTYSFSLGQISQTDGDLNFFDNDREDKENGDLLYYGWPDDIGNFEDVDRMFRSCDSTFGLGSLSNEDDLCWFSSSHSTEGSEDAMMLGSKLPSSEGSALNCISDYNEAPKLATAGPLVIETNKKILLIGDKASSNADIVTEHSEFGHLQFSNGSGARSVHKDDLMLEEQLDTRTKLCIRDSLYRLARSAEQRHNCVNANGGKRDDRDTSGPLMAEETNKGTAFLDIETDTNPIDRSIAHLLFHRPSDPSAMPTNDALSLKSHTMAHGSITSPQMMAKKQVCQEETVNGADKSFTMSGNKS